MEFQQLKLNNPGILIGKVPVELYHRVRNVVTSQEYKSIPANGYLIGHLEEQYSCPNIPEFDAYVKTMFNSWCLEFNRPIREAFIDKLWTNFQKKHEFNPNHNHSGEASFVLWLDIPYSLTEELSLDNCKGANGPGKNSLFQFTYSALNGKIQWHDIPVDQTYQGTIMMFPSDLIHCVYPFYTSDNYRISVSGNVFTLN